MTAKKKTFPSVINHLDEAHGKLRLPRFVCRLRLYFCTLACFATPFNNLSLVLERSTLQYSHQSYEVNSK